MLKCAVYVCILIGISITVICVSVHVLVRILDSENWFMSNKSSVEKTVTETQFCKTEGQH